jgi:hypothetical protein
MDMPARQSWPPPFEPLRADQRQMRLRAVRDGLIITGWLCTGFMFFVVTPLAHSLGYDAFAYWSVDPSDLYGRAMDNTAALGALRYTPPFALLSLPLSLLPWWLFVWLYTALMLGALTWLGGRWTLVMLALPPVALELYHGNVHLLIAAAIVLGFRYPWSWAFVVLTKVTPGIGLLWFAVRREWRSLAIALSATGLCALVAFVIWPNSWSEWGAMIISNLDEAAPYTAPFPWVRIAGAAVLVAWGGLTDRPWTVPIAATLALPTLSPLGVSVALGAVPLIRRGDRSALLLDWRDAVQPRTLLVSLGVFLGGALVLALLFTGPISQLTEWASSGLFQR